MWACPFCNSLQHVILSSFSPQLSVTDRGNRHSDAGPYGFLTRLSYFHGTPVFVCGFVDSLERFKASHGWGQLVCTLLSFVPWPHPLLKLTLVWSFHAETCCPSAFSVRAVGPLHCKSTQLPIRKADPILSISYLKYLGSSSTAQRLRTSQAWLGFRLLYCQSLILSPLLPSCLLINSSHSSDFSSNLLPWQCLSHHHHRAC